MKAESKIFETSLEKKITEGVEPIPLYLNVNGSTRVKTVLNFGNLSPIFSPKTKDSSHKKTLVTKTSTGLFNSTSIFLLLHDTY